MTVYFNNSTSKITAINFNSNKMKKVYYNGVLVFSAGSDVWSSAEVYLTTGNYIGIRIYDSNNVMVGNSTNFSITYTLYRGTADPANAIKSDTITDKPNSDTGNITFSTEYKPAYDVNYCAYIEIEGTDKYSEWSGTTESKIVKTYTYISKPTAKNRTYNGDYQYAFDDSDGYLLSGSRKNVGTVTTTAILNDGYKWSDGTSSTYTASSTINKATITSSDIVITMGKSDGCVRAKVTCGFSGLTYTGKFRRKSDDKLGALKTGTTGSWVESTWKVADDSYGFRVYSIEGNSNINGWSGDKGAGSWYSG